MYSSPSCSLTSALTSLPVLMLLGETDPRACFAFEVEFDEDGRFSADYPAVVTGFDHHHLRGDEVARAAIGELHVYLPAREEPDVSVRAGFCADCGGS